MPCCAPLSTPVTTAGSLGCMTATPCLQLGPISGYWLAQTFTRLKGNVYLGEMPTNCLDACFPALLGLNITEWAQMGDQEVSAILVKNCVDGRSQAGVMNAAGGHVNSGFGASILDRNGAAAFIGTLGDAAGVQVPNSTSFLSYRDGAGNLWAGYFDGDVQITGNLTATGLVGVTNSWQDAAVPGTTDFITLNPTDPAVSSNFTVTTGVMDMGPPDSDYPVGLGVVIENSTTEPAIGGLAVYDRIKGTRAVVGASGSGSSAHAIWASSPNTNDSGAVVGGIDDGTMVHITDSLFRMGYKDALGALWSAYLSGPAKLGVYTVATAPDATTHTAGIIFVSDGNAGSPCIAVSNGTSWLRIALGAAVSAT